MMRNRSKVSRRMISTGWILLLFSFLSCADGPFMPDSADTTVKVSLPPSGFYSKGKILTFTITDPSQTPTWSDYESRLLDSQGFVIGFWKGLQSDGPNYSIEIPSDIVNWVDGDNFQLEVTVLNKSLIQTTKLLDFFLVEKIPELGVSTNPTEVYPGSRVLIEILKDEPWLGKTWIQWKWKDKVIQEGPWNVNAVLRWNSPDVEGSFALTAEVPSRSTYLFSSPLKYDAPVVTTFRSPQYGPSELQPDESYFSLYHFRGNLRDSGTMADYTQPVVWGGLDIDHSDGVFGVRFKPGTKLERVGSPLPLDENGGLQPFSITVKGVLAPFPEGVLYTLKNADGGLSFNLAIVDKSWVMTYSLGGGQGSFSTPYGENQVFSQTLSYLPNNAAGGDLLWFNGSELADSRYIDWQDIPLFLEDGITTLGGDGGFSGILDEFGVYYKDNQNRFSADGGLLERELKNIDSGSLIWAAGFDGSYLDEGFIASTGFKKNRGKGVFAPGQWLDSPVSEDFESDILIDMGEFTTGTLKLELWESGENPQTLAQIRSEEAVRKLQVTFNNNTEPFSIKDGLGFVTILPPKGGYKVRISSVEDIPVQLESIVCVRLTPPEITEILDETSQESIQPLITDTNPISTSISKELLKNP